MTSFIGGTGESFGPTINQRFAQVGAAGSPTQRPRRVAGVQPLGGTSNGFSGGMGTFTGTNNLVGSQIMPSDSADTRQAQGWTTQSGADYNAGAFRPLQSVAPLDYGAERGMLNGANGQMQGLSYDTTRANGAYAQSQGQLGSAAATARGTLQGMQAMGAGSFSGGGANLADTSGLTAGLGRAEATMGAPFAYEADTGTARGLTLAALQRAQSAPDRNTLGAEALSLYEERSRPGYEQSLRSVTARNAAMGRRGSGLTTNELTDVSTARERELALARRDQALQAANLTMQDNTDRTNLAMGVTQGFGGLDTNAAQTRIAQAQAQAEMAAKGFDAQKFNAGQAESAAQRSASGARYGADLQRGIAGDLYGFGQDASALSMGLGDRYGTQERDRVGLGERAADFQRGTANDLAGLTTTRYNADVRERDTGRADEYNQDTARQQRFTTNQGYLTGRESRDYNQRQEVRGERAYQNDLSNQALDREFQRSQFEEQMRNGRYNRAQGTAALGFNAPSPGGAYQSAADAAGRNSSDSYGAIANWMQMYGQRRNGAGTGTSSGVGRGDGGTV